MAPPHLLLLTLVMTIITNNCNTRCVPISKPRFPAIFVFGDSTVDTGNNNYIPTLFRGDHLPYGQDFPGHIPTGRFSNGKLIPDFVASFLGIKEAVPPFLDPNLSDHDIKTGVCFASAASGFDGLTTEATTAILVSKQVRLFKRYIKRLKCIVGERKAHKTIARAMIILSAGTNDFALNYYDIPRRRKDYNISGYQDFLLNELKDSVKGLYTLGGRLMVVAGLPPLGCLPIQMTANFRFPWRRTCLEDQNLEAQSYNKKLAVLLPKLQASLRGSLIAYANVYKPLMNMVNHPQKYGASGLIFQSDATGFTRTTTGCCGTGLVEGGLLCNEATPTCHNSSEYLFWDSIHPTTLAYKSIAESLEKELMPHFLSHLRSHPYRNSTEA